RVHDFEPRLTNGSGDFRQREFTAAPSILVRDAFTDRGEQGRGTAKEVPASDASRPQNSMGFVNVRTDHGFYGDVMKCNVTKAEVETLVGEGQVPEPIDFDEMHLWQMWEPLAATSNHFA